MQGLPLAADGKREGTNDSDAPPGSKSIATYPRWTTRGLASGSKMSLCLNGWYIGMRLGQLSFLSVTCIFLCVVSNEVGKGGSGELVEHVDLIVGVSGHPRMSIHTVNTSVICTLTFYSGIFTFILKRLFH